MDNTWLFVHMMTKTIMNHDTNLVAGGTCVDGSRVDLVLVVLVVVYAVLQVGQLFLKSFCCFELNNFFVINIIVALLLLLYFSFLFFYNSPLLTVVGNAIRN